MAVAFSLTDSVEALLVPDWALTGGTPCAVIPVRAVIVCLVCVCVLICVLVCVVRVFAGACAPVVADTHVCVCVHERCRDRWKCPPAAQWCMVWLKGIRCVAVSVPLGFRV